MPIDIDPALGGLSSKSERVELDLPKGERRATSWLNLLLRQSEMPLDWTVKDGRVVVANASDVANSERLAIAKIHAIPVDVIEEPSANVHRLVYALEALDPTIRPSVGNPLQLIELPGASAISKSDRYQRHYQELIDALVGLMRNPARRDPVRIGLGQPDERRWREVSSRVISFRCDEESVGDVVQKLADQ